MASVNIPKKYNIKIKSTLIDEQIHALNVSVDSTVSCGKNLNTVKLD